MCWALHHSCGEMRVCVHEIVRVFAAYPCVYILNHVSVFAFQYLCYCINAYMFDFLCLSMPYYVCILLSWMSCLHVLFMAVGLCPCYSLLCFHTCISTLKCNLVCFVSLLLKPGAPLPLLCRSERDRFLCPPQPCPSNVIKRAAPLDSTNQSTEPFILPLGSAGRP